MTDVVSAESHWSTRLPRKRVAADCLCVDVQGRILLVEPTYKASWDLPGGVVEDGESPRQAAIRECSEELGVTVQLGHLLVVDWVPTRPDGTTDVLALLFDGGAATIRDADLRPDGREIRSGRFVPVTEAEELLDPATFHRVEAALRVRSTGAPPYLEDGSPPD